MSLIEGGLPEHEWVVSLLIPVTRRELDRVACGQAKTFKVRIPPVDDESPVRAWAIFCTRCKVASELMTPQELDGCRGPRDEE